MLIGLTGQIGSGKTEVATLLAARGAKIIDADRIGREVVNRNSQLSGLLVKSFGRTIVGKNGRLRRKVLARLAFATKQSKKQLDTIVHPFLLEELRRVLNKAAGGAKPIVIDAALLLDWGLDRELDVVLVVAASRELRLRRLQERGIGRADALARERLQPSSREFTQRADVVIRNNGTRRELAEKVDRTWALLFDH